MQAFFAKILSWIAGYLLIWKSGRDSYDKDQLEQTNEIQKKQLKVRRHSYAGLLKFLRRNK